MLARLARLLATVGLTLLGLLLVTFLIARVVPIDPVLAVVGDRASSAVYARARAEMGLDRPVCGAVRALCRDGAHGDFGRSALDAKPGHRGHPPLLPRDHRTRHARDAHRPCLWACRRASSRRRGTIDGPTMCCASSGCSAIRCRCSGSASWRCLLFYADLGWVAGPGRLDPWLDGFRAGAHRIFAPRQRARRQSDASSRSALAHLALPAAVLGYFSLAYISRMTRSLMLEQLGQDYIMVARAKGLSECRVLWRHALGNVLVPLATVRRWPMPVCSKARC